MNKKLSLFFIAFGCLYAASSSAAYLDKDGHIVTRHSGLLDSVAPSEGAKKTPKSKKVIQPRKVTKRKEFKNPRKR